METEWSRRFTHTVNTGLSCVFGIAIRDGKLYNTNG